MSKSKLPVFTCWCSGGATFCTLRVSKDIVRTVDTTASRSAAGSLYFALSRPSSMKRRINSAILMPVFFESFANALT
jgi:hypothetical protein